jgi:hypothetical protein
MSVEMKKDPVRQIAAILGILSIVLAVMVILLAVNVIPTLNSNRSARLVNVGMGGVDVPDQHIVHIHGWVCNVGLDTAYHVQIHVVGVYTTGGEAMDTYVDVGSGTVFGSYSAEVTADVGYSANGLGSWTVTPVWSYTP